MNSVNLIPTDQRRGPGAGSLGVYAVLGVLTLVLVLVTALVLTSNRVDARRSSLAAVTQQRKALTTQVTALQPYVSYATLEQTRLATVRSLASSRFDWQRAMRGLSHVTTPQVWLTKMLGTVAPGVTVGSGAGGGSASDAGSGGDTSALRSAVPAPAIELSGCGVSNDAVVAYASRLRALKGVERVTLASSGQPDEGAGSTTGATAAPGTDGSSAGCGSKPATATFAAVVFFTALPTAAAPGGDATAAATPTPTTAGATP
jgi:Tfp pilus assembly protein PilN